MTVTGKSLSEFIRRAAAERADTMLSPTVADAGPLVALIDADDADHEMCRAVLGQVELPLVTTWPAFTEALFLLIRAGGSAGREALWKLVLSERLQVLDLARSPWDAPRS